MLAQIVERYQDFYNGANTSFLDLTGCVFTLSQKWGIRPAGPVTVVLKMCRLKNLAENKYTFYRFSGDIYSQIIAFISEISDVRYSKNNSEGKSEEKKLTEILTPWRSNL
jgi:hypothetical protein